MHLVSHEFIGADVTCDYDPLAADPDYLVIGQFARLSKIYNQVLSEGEFQWVNSCQGYDVTPEMNLKQLTKCKGIYE